MDRENNVNDSIGIGNRTISSFMVQCVYCWYYHNTYYMCYECSSYYIGTTLNSLLVSVFSTVFKVGVAFICVGVARPRGNFYV